MKISVLLIALFAISQSASAQTSDCRNIPSPKDRLACYDKKAPTPNLPEKKATKQGGEKEVMTDPHKFLDEEDARMKKALKPICQRC